MRLGALATTLFFVALGCNAIGCNASSSAPPEPSATSSAPISVRPTVTWPPDSTIDARAVDALGEPDRVRALVARSPVPILAPTNVTLERPTFVVEGEYYALTGRVRGATIAIQGTRAAHRYEGMEPMRGNRTLRGQRALVSVNEGIRTSSWLENGAAYSVDVECAAATDERCASDAFVVSVAEHLAYAGGSGR